MPQKRRYEVHEVLSLLEDEAKFTEATLFISASEDQSYGDEDKADDEGVTSNNFTRRQFDWGICRGYNSQEKHENEAWLQR